MRFPIPRIGPWNLFLDWYDWFTEGVPLRLYVTTKNWSILIGARSQPWSKEFGYANPTSDRYKRITRHPREVCGEHLGDGVVCALRKSHPQDHWNWKKKASMHIEKVEIKPPKTDEKA